MARRPASCAPARRASRASKGRASICGPTASTSWAGSVDPTGLGVIFDRAIPPFAEENVGAAVDGILARIGVERASVDRFACHPGGAKVITALEATLRLDQGTLDHERAVLEEYGNMSAPTVLFVLDRLVEAGPAQAHAC